MASNKESEFIEHYFLDKNFITDIWYRPGTGRYHSVVTDIHNESFETVEQIREALNQITYAVLGHTSHSKEADKHE